MVKKNLTEEQKDQFLKELQQCGVICKAIDKVPGLSRWLIDQECRRSSVFKQKLIEAKEQYWMWLGDDALAVVVDAMQGKPTPKSQLVAAFAIANAHERGFAPKRVTESKVEHNVNVRTAIPRPKYAQPTIEAVIREIPEKL